MTTQEIAEMVLRKLKQKLETYYLESGIPYDEQDDSCAFKHVDFDEYLDLKKDCVELPGEWLEMARLPQYGNLATLFRRLKFKLPEGTFNLIDLAARDEKWKRMEYVLSHLTSLSPSSAGTLYQIQTGRWVFHHISHKGFRHFILKDGMCYLSSHNLRWFFREQEAAFLEGDFEFGVHSVEEHDREYAECNSFAHFCDDFKADDEVFGTSTFLRLKDYALRVLSKTTNTFRILYAIVKNGLSTVFQKTKDVFTTLVAWVASFQMEFSELLGFVAWVCSSKWTPFVGIGIGGIVLSAYYLMFKSSTKLCKQCSNSVESVRATHNFIIERLHPMCLDGLCTCDSVRERLVAFEAVLCCSSSCDDSCAHGMAEQVDMDWYDALVRKTKIPLGVREELGISAVDLEDSAQSLRLRRKQFGVEDSSCSLKLRRGRVVMEDSSLSLRGRKKKLQVEDSSSSIRMRRKHLKVEEHTEELLADESANSLFMKLAKEVNLPVFRSRGNGPAAGHLKGIFFGKFCITPGHLFRGFEYSYWGVRKENGVEKEIPLKLVKKDEDKDVALWSLPDSCNAFPQTFYNHLVARDDVDRYFNTAAGFYLNLSRNGVISNSVVNGFLEPKVTACVRDGTTGEVGEKEYTELVKVSTFSSCAPPTQAGDCGGLLIMIHPRATKKICGFHILGGTDDCYSVLLYKEYVDKLINSVYGVVREEIAVEIDPQPEDNGDVDLMNIVPFVNSKPKIVFAADSPVQYVGNYVTSTCPGSVSTLRIHPLYGAFEVTKVPAPCSVAEVEDTSQLEINELGFPDLVKTNLAKYAEKLPQVEGLDRDLSDMVDQLTTLFVSEMEGADLSLMTEVEALSGRPDYEGSLALDMDTTPGEPWSRVGPTPGKKKSAYLKISRLPSGRKMYSINRDVEHGRMLVKVIEEKDALLKQGIRMLSLWKNCLKDETRSIAKAKIGKTRLFTAVPMETAVLSRVYFGKFKEVWQDLRGKLLHSVGINPRSVEWAKLKLYLESRGEDCFDADFSNYDGRLRADFMQAAGQIVINTILKVSGGDRLAMETLWDEFVNTYHLSYSEVHLITQGNPSGNPMTTVLNCIVNLLYHWWCYRKITKITNLNSFRDKVGFTCFGDDVIYTTNVKISGYSFEAVSAWMGKLGQVYTTAQKDGGDGASRAITEITFLKRSFKVVQGYVLSPIDPESIEQQFNYTNIGEGDHMKIKIQIEEAVLEAVALGAEYYSQFIGKLTEALSRNVSLRRKIGVNLPSYCEAFDTLCKRIEVTKTSPVEKKIKMSSFSQMNSTVHSVYTQQMETVEELVGGITSRGVESAIDAGKTFLGELLPRKRTEVKTPIPVSALFKSQPTSMMSGQGLETTQTEVGVETQRVAVKMLTPSGEKQVIQLTQDSAADHNLCGFIPTVDMPELGFVWGVDGKFSPRTIHLMKLFQYYSTAYLYKIVAKPSLFASQRVWVTFEDPAITTASQYDGLGFDWNPSEENEIYVAFNWQQQSPLESVLEVSNHMPQLSVVDASNVIYADGIATTIDYQVYVAPLNMVLANPVVSSVYGGGTTGGGDLLPNNVSESVVQPWLASEGIEIALPALYEGEEWVMFQMKERSGQSSVRVVDADGTTDIAYHKLDSTNEVFYICKSVFPPYTPYRLTVDTFATACTFIWYRYYNVNNPRLPAPPAQTKRTRKCYEEQIFEYQNVDAHNTVSDTTHGTPLAVYPRAQKHWSLGLVQYFNTSADVLVFSYSLTHTAGGPMADAMLHANYPAFKFLASSVPTSNVLIRITQIPRQLVETLGGLVQLTLSEALELPGIEWDPKTGPVTVQPVWDYFRVCQNVYPEKPCYLQMNIIGGSIGTEPIAVTPYYNFSAIRLHGLVYKRSQPALMAKRQVYTEQIDSTLEATSNLSTESVTPSGSPQMDNTRIGGIPTSETPVTGGGDIVHAAPNVNRWELASTFNINPNHVATQFFMRSYYFGPHSTRESTGFRYWKGRPKVMFIFNCASTTNTTIHFVQMPPAFDITEYTTDRLIDLVSDRPYGGVSPRDGPYTTELEWLTEHNRVYTDAYLNEHAIAPTRDLDSIGSIILITENHVQAGLTSGAIPEVIMCTMFIDTSNVEYMIPSAPSQAVALRASDRTVRQVFRELVQQKQPSSEDKVIQLLELFRSLGFSPTQGDMAGVPSGSTTIRRGRGADDFGALG